MSTDLYSFVMRGWLAEEALDQAGRQRRAGLTQVLDREMVHGLSLDVMDEAHVARASKMATVYAAIAAFENSARDLVSSVLLEKKGADWWTSSVSQKIRDRAESRRGEEAQVKWHVQRGDDPITFIDFGNLGDIIGQNWEHFEPHLVSLEWAKQIFDTLERSRNVIMHSGQLGDEDVERVAINIRDWIKQVGA